MRLSKKKRRQISAYKELILEKNRSFNLVSRKGAALKLKLLFDQGLLAGRALAPVFKSLSSPALDLGSGNGLPGLLLAILFPKNIFFLCERSRKKAEFLKSAASRAQTLNAQVLCQSADRISARYELILSQAALPIKKALPVLEKILAPKGQAFLWHSPSWERAWPKSAGFQAEALKPYKSPAGERLLLKIQRAGL